MRPLTDEEMRVFFEKLQSYIGTNVTKLIDRTDEPYTFRLVLPIFINILELLLLLLLYVD